jgi:carbonic anhydrase/acetyltransferase-like protein (isoleucine patch superfamily)
MALIKTVRGFVPEIGNNCFLAENATILGQVSIGDDCSIWFNTVLRGDVNYIKIGNNTNVQDGVIIHGTFEKFPTNIGNSVSIAHGAIVHGCTIHDHVLIGMGAIVMDGAVVESYSIVAAGSIVTQGTLVKSGSVFGGSPAKLIKEISHELYEGQVSRIARSYALYASWYKENESQSST